MKLKTVIAVSMVCLLPTFAFAKDGKHSDPIKGHSSKRSPTLDPLTKRDTPLSAKEKRGVSYAKQWVNNRNQPARGKDGGVVFTFGATLPSVVCAPLYVCDLVLQEGEVVNDIHVGDSVRWQISPATQGTEDKAITHIIIKPNDVGLTTNLVVITNRRSYSIKLVSQRKSWMPRISFRYPDGLDAKWSAYKVQRNHFRERQEAERVAKKESGTLSARYSVFGAAPWRPLRVYAQGGKTYIHFPRRVSQGDLPILVALGKQDDGILGLFSERPRQMVNYRYVDHRFVVDKVLNEAVLISGKGNNRITVMIERRKQHRGF